MYHSYSYSKVDDKNKNALDFQSKGTASCSVMGAGASNRVRGADPFSSLSETHAAIMIQNKQRQRIARDKVAAVRHTKLADEIKLVQKEEKVRVAEMPERKAVRKAQKKANEAAKRRRASNVIQTKVRQRAAGKQVSTLRKQKTEEVAAQQTERVNRASLTIQSRTRQRQAQLLVESRREVRLEGELNSDELLLAAEAGHAELVESLLGEGNAHPNWRDRDGRTALHYAALHGFTDVLLVLLEKSQHRGNTNDATKKSGGCDDQGTGKGGQRILADPSLMDREGRTPLGLARDGVAAEGRAKERAALRKPLFVTKEILYPQTPMMMVSSLPSTSLPAPASASASAAASVAVVAVGGRPEPTSPRGSQSPHGGGGSLASLSNKGNLSPTFALGDSVVRDSFGNGLNGGDNLVPETPVPALGEEVRGVFSDGHKRFTDAAGTAPTAVASMPTISSSAIAPSSSTTTAASQQQQQQHVLLSSRQQQADGWGKHAQAVAILEAAGAKVSQLEANASLLQAVEKGDLTELRRCVFGPDDADPDCFSLGEAMVGAYHREIPRPDKGQTDDTRKSLHPKDVVTCVGKGYGNHTPLHRASLFNRPACAKVLLQECGSDPNLTNDEVLFSETALHVACHRGAAAVVKVLMADGRTDPDAVDNCRDTPLHMAARNGHAGCVKALIEGGGGGPAVTRGQDDGGGGGGGADNGSGGHGQQQHERGKTGGGKEEGGTEGDTAREGRRQGRVVAAGSSQNKNGAAPASLSLKGFKARTPLGLARDGVMAQEEEEEEQRQASSSSRRQQQQRQGAGASGTKKKSSSSSSSSSSRQQPPPPKPRFSACASSLEAAGARISQEEADSGLLDAALCGNLELCRQLVEGDGANPNCTRPFVDVSSWSVDDDGWRPLHCACSKGHADVVDYLLYKGSDKLKVDKQGRTPRTLADELGFEVCSRRLRDKHDGSGDHGEGGGLLTQPFGFFGRGGPSAFGFEGLDDIAQGRAPSSPQQKREGGGGSDGDGSGDGDGGSSDSGGSSVGSGAAGAGAGAKVVSLTSLDSRDKRQALRAAALLAAAKFGDYVRAKSLLTAPERFGFPSHNRNAALANTKSEIFNLRFYTKDENHQADIEAQEGDRGQQQPRLSTTADDEEEEQSAADSSLFLDTDSVSLEGGEDDEHEDDEDDPGAFSGHYRQHSFAEDERAGEYNGRPLVQCQAPMFGDSPLMLASYRGDGKMVKLLLRHGADVNARDRLNWTPLHYAAFTGTNPRAIWLLLRAGADTAAENSDGRTPAMVARYNRRPQDIALLIEKPVKTKQQKPGY